MISGMIASNYVCLICKMHLLDSYRFDLNDWIVIKVANDIILKWHVVNKCVIFTSYYFAKMFFDEHFLTYSKELVLDGESGEKMTGHFNCSIDSKYIGEPHSLKLNFGKYPAMHTNYIHPKAPLYNIIIIVHTVLRRKRIFKYEK